MGLFSDIAGELFGKKPKVETSQLPTLSPEQSTLLQQLIGQMGGSPDIGDVGGGTKPYGGTLAPDLSSLERTSLAALEQMAMNAAEGGGVMDQAETAAGRAMREDTFDEEAFDKYFSEAVAQPTLDMFQRDVLPEMTRRFSGSAAFGSDRMTAERGATQDLMKALTGARAESAFKTSEAGKDRALTAAGLAPALTGAKTGQLVNLLAAGGVPREVQDTKIARDYQEFLRQQESKSKAFDRALSLLGVRPIENVSVVNPGKPGLLQGLAPGLGMALGTKFLR